MQYRRSGARGDLGDDGAEKSETDGDSRPEGLGRDLYRGLDTCRPVEDGTSRSGASGPEGMEDKLALYDDTRSQDVPGQVSRERVRRSIMTALLGSDTMKSGGGEIAGGERSRMCEA